MVVSFTNGWARVNSWGPQSVCHKTTIRVSLNFGVLNPKYTKVNRYAFYSLKQELLCILYKTTYINLKVVHTYLTWLECLTLRGNGMVAMFHKHDKHVSWHIWFILRPIRLWKLVSCNDITTGSLPYHIPLKSYVLVFYWSSAKMCTIKRWI